MSTPPTTEPGTPRERLFAGTGLAVLAAVLLGLFLPAFVSPLIFDDNLSIRQIERLDHWWQAFQPDVFSFYRPVKNLFFFLCLEAGGSPVLFHSVTLAAYLLATFGVFALARRLTSSPLWGLAAAAIWSLSAAHATLGIWASCFNISMAAAALGFGLACWDRWRESPSRLFSATGFFAWLVVGLLSYETAIAIAPLAVLLDLYRGRRVFSKDAILRYAAIAVIVLAYLLLRRSSQADFDDIGNPGFPSWIQSWQISASAPYFLWTHFMMWLAPWGRLEFFGNYIWDQSIPAIILPFCWLLLAGLVVLGVRFWQPGRLVIAGAAMFFIAAFPSGNFIPIRNTPYADYYVPIPAIGLTLLTIGILRALACHAREHKGPRQGVRNAAIACIALIAAARAANVIAMVDWIDAWKRPVMIMAKTALARPFQYHAKGTAAVMMESIGDHATAESYARAALADCPEIAVPDFVLGKIHYQRGEFDTAAAHFRQVIEKRQVTSDIFFDAHLYLGRIIGRDPDKADEAFEHFFILLSRSHNYNHVTAILAAAETFGRAKRHKDQIEVLERGLHYHPDDRSIQQALDAARKESAEPS